VHSRFSSDTALVVLSGGQDSTTCLLLARRAYKTVHAITFDYNQRHRREILAARRVAALVGVESHEIVTLGPILSSTSPLTDPQQSLEQYPSFPEMEQTIGDRVELTFVPMRNVLFMTLAFNRAVALGAGAVITGICQQDGTNYPDCTAAFAWQMQSLAHEALGLPLAPVLSMPYLLAPLLNITKADSIRQLLLAVDTQERDLAAGALAFSHTAYDGAYPPTGSDHATVLREEGFRRAGVMDPIRVRAWMENLLPLPEGDPRSADLLHDPNHWLTGAVAKAMTKLDMKNLYMKNLYDGREG